MGVLAGLGLVMGFSRWRAMRPRSQTEPELAPHERALQRLAHLREHQPRGFEETRAYYVEASNLLRQYIEERDSLCGSGMTTEEFLTDPQTVSSFRVPHRQMLSAFLTHCDLVKFARHPTTEAEREQVLSAAETFVQETRGEGIAEGGAA